MVVKKCPICDQTLPVACKSCPCGHVFISKKQLMPTQDKPDAGDGSPRDQRLRPEVPRREIKDFDYDFGTKTSPTPVETGENHEKERNLLIIENPSQSCTVSTTDVPTRSYITIPQPMSNERKRGRPKGSKNKPKPVLQPGEEATGENEQSLCNGSQNTELGDSSKRKRGRPKGSKNKPKDPSLLKSAKGSQGTDGWSSDQPDDLYLEPPLDAMPHISKEKAVSYSIVLSDINQKMMKQSSMNFV